MPLSADLMLPETSSVSCVSVPTLAGVGEDTGSRKLGPCPGTLKGVFTTVSNCFRKEGHTKDTGVAKEIVAHLSLRSARNTMGTRGTPE